MNTALIPARGGSKRIPRKNIRAFEGRPIIAYSIEAAIASKLFERVIVSTDDEEIASLAVKWGAEAPFVRPKELSDDHTGTNAVVRHAIQWLQDRGARCDLVCCIYPTAPFVDAGRLKMAYEKLRESGKSYAFPVTTFPFPIQRAVRINADGEIEPIQPEHVDTRSQDLEPAYHDAGQFYWGRAQAFLDDVPVYSAEAATIVLPRHLVQDIDTPEDWRRAELLYRVLRKKGELAA